MARISCFSMITVMVFLMAPILKNHQMLICSIPPDGDNSYAQKFDPSGNPIDAPFFIHTPSNPGSQYDPKVLQFENGEFVVVWSNAGAPLGPGLVTKGLVSMGSH